MVGASGQEGQKMLLYGNAVEKTVVVGELAIRYRCSTWRTTVIAHAEKRPVGFMIIDSGPYFDFGFVRRISVNERMRRRKIGTTMFFTMEEEMRKLGAFGSLGISLEEMISHYGPEECVTEFIAHINWTRKA
jgi:hypothetical protein